MTSSTSPDIEYLKELGYELEPLLTRRVDNGLLLRMIRERIIGIITRMEDSASDYYGDSEDKISNIIANMINADSLQVFNARREENRNGHADLSIVANSVSGEFLYVGEAKIWSSFGKFEGGLGQLTRYMTGGHKAGFMLVYIKTKSCEPTFTNALHCLKDKGKVFKLQQKTDSNPRYSCANHTHSSGQQIEIDFYRLHIPK